MYIYYIHMYIYIENVITETTHFPSQPQNIYIHIHYYFIFSLYLISLHKKKGGMGVGRENKADR